ncbi:unnamed protein product [Clonostachys chloroleuca]|uniref:Rhodopsin domain-containing protein n=1 Tax=Clonostachys chloroleuca TaxID=1926264 RepID=A0AA35VBX8_9HYPO|nr:unnamed protein product [Clonostachys chloroleuca]
MTILRMYKAIKFIDSNDVTADFGSLILTSMAELTIGLICSCFPAVSILIKRQSSPGSSHAAIRTSSIFDRLSAILRAWE